jgi:thiosulfate/3-mercaptopyruvate sulfurtransferase
VIEPARRHLLPADAMTELEHAPALDPQRLICDAATLAAWRDDPSRRVVVVDVSFDLADPAAGERAYAQERLPGAFYAHLDRDLSAPKSAGRDPRGRHPLPDREVFARAVAAWGIRPQSQVVVYDRQGAMFAVRLWWMLRWLGHDTVAVLDGGLPAWRAFGQALETGAPSARPDAGAAPYPASRPTVPTIEAGALQHALGRVRLVDARAPERFRGEVEPLDPVAGHIPGAMNRFFQQNLQGDGRFKSPAELRRELEPLLRPAGAAADDPVVHQCGSGVTACHNVLAQAVAGLGLGTLYPGSWSEWCADPARPVARGG